MSMVIPDSPEFRSRPARLAGPAAAGEPNSPAARGISWHCVECQRGVLAEKGCAARSISLVSGWRRPMLGQLFVQLPPCAAASWPVLRPGFDDHDRDLLSRRTRRRPGRNGAPADVRCKSPHSKSCTSSPAASARGEPCGRRTRSDRVRPSSRRRPCDATPWVPSAILCSGFASTRVT